MDDIEARMWLEAHRAYLQRIGRRTLPALLGDYRNDLADRSREILYGGPRSRDEVIRALLELHYPAARMNEARHVIGHLTRGWSACNFCHDPDGLHDGHLCECDRHAETDCTAPGCKHRRAAFHFSSTFHRTDDGRCGRPTLTDHGRLGHDYQGALRPLLHLNRADLDALAATGDVTALAESARREAGGI